MPKPLPYRKASGEPATPHRAFILRRYLLIPLFLLALIALIFLIAGNEAPAVFQTWVPAIFLLPILVAATMLGIALTAPFAKQNTFDNSPYPHLFRLILSLALGLGALALATLLLGTLNLIEPGHTPSPTPPHLPTGGYPWAPALLLFPAALIGFLPSRTFLKSFTWLPFKKPIHRSDYLILLAAVPTAILLIAATYPPGSLWLTEGHGYDVLEYHLQLPREYALHNSTAPLSHNVYSYFPQNIEMLYLLTSQISKFAMGNSLTPATADGYLWGIYPSQLLHAFLMLTTAAALALTPIRLSTSARFLALILFLSIPWTLITGSLAYNEAGMLLFGTLALSLALQTSSSSSSSLPPPYARPLLIGILLGLALGCKMTAGIFFALPIAAILLLNAFPRKESPMISTGAMPSGARAPAGMPHVRPTKQLHPLLAIALTALIAAAIYSPWAIRAAIYSGGNPLFPIATSILPKSNWTPEQSQRFINGHSAKQNNTVLSPFNIAARAKALVTESILSPQWSPAYASIYQWANEKPDDALWKQIGLLWIIAPIALALALLAALRQKSPAALTHVLSLFLLLTLQLLAWMFLTHLQSRFLLPIAVPLALLIAQGSQGLGENVGGLPLGVLRILITITIALQALCTIFLLLPESDLLMGTVSRHNRPPRQQPIGHLFDLQINWPAYAEDPTGAKSLDRNPPLGKTLLIGGITPLFDQGDIQYNTVFDQNPFADSLKSQSPAQTLHYLHDQHINYILINWDEITRLKNSYGYEDSVTPAAIDSLVHAGLTPIPLPNQPYFHHLQLLQVSPTTAPP